MIKLLYEGEFVRKNNIIKKASSSITFIQTKSHNIIVDTSTKDKRELIIKELKKLNLEPKDIDVVINTHRHCNHVANNDLFCNAEIYSSAQECIVEYNGCKLYTSIDEIEEFTPIEKFQDDEITILKTPGHTYGSVSVVYGDYVIVGDAAPLRENIIEDILPPSIVDYRSAKGSLRRIKLLKKNVITGHDGIVYKEEFI
ncbi:beta-lactamase domain protein [Methanocaldococcus vulcanius M7]|uniref:Metallo-beta-lactamase domain-containing protein 1 n=1 Tax=Methanocaldococcus vulcanius (strain ATCC 700851 / DSM 12094 / M7) TaxID=579137 RepID=C9RH86_METVM|nr:MBL fold metallo-hydrolase [Methanocaldococcus vulcanius]ACX72938.1 beta-lactamase domain protein [Methanocaldococcus vulcanius M7]